ncbi:MAG: hypothetical protein AB1757_20410 [Acidobacteriota bacterium]
MQFFNQLGELIEQRWRDKNYDETSFPEIAAAALNEMPPHRHIATDAILQWVQAKNNLPRQMDVEGRFGNPPITLYVGQRFYIDVYFWLDGTTSIHQHSFCGAFQVLQGSSIHSRYDFDLEQNINQHLATGQVQFKNVELLQVGGTRQIASGKQFIHALFHLDRPSATICVRTPQDIKTLPQYDYLKPYLARDPFFRNEMLTKKMQTLNLLFGMKHPETDAFMGELISTADFQTTFSALDMAFNYLTADPTQTLFKLTGGTERFQRLLEQARRRHGELIDLIPPVFDEIKRQNAIVGKRAYVSDSDLRFFLALLLNVPDKRMILELVKQRFPESEPAAMIGAWVMELANTKAFGTTEPNLLGIADFDEDYRFVLERLMEGNTTEQIQTAIKQQFPTDYGESLLEDLEMICRQVREAGLFKALFAEQG